MKYTILERLIIFFSIITQGNIKKARLVKFIFLADLVAVERGGHLLQDEDWCKCCDGPCSKSVDKYLKKLCDDKIIYIEKEFIKTNIGFDINSLGFSDIEISSFTAIAKKWAFTYDIEDIQEYISKLVPVVCTRLNEPIDLTINSKHFLTALLKIIRNYFRLP